MCDHQSIIALHETSFDGYVSHLKLALKYAENSNLNENENKNKNIIHEKRKNTESASLSAFAHRLCNLNEIAKILMRLCEEAVIFAENKETDYKKKERRKKNI